jgi:hypothetical protein
MHGECPWANQICEQPNHHGCRTCLAVEPVRPTPAPERDRAAEVEAAEDRAEQVAYDAARERS